jgi:cysteine desulfurase/selenocysteine lyase
MQDVTPDLIASIATRLYNEVQGASAGSQPATSVPPFAPHSPGSTTGMPGRSNSGFDIPAHGSGKSESNHGTAFPHGDYGLPNHSAGVPHQTSAFPNHAPGHVPGDAGSHVPGQASGMQQVPSSTPHQAQHPFSRAELPGHAGASSHPGMPGPGSMPSHPSVPSEFPFANPASVLGQTGQNFMPGQTGLPGQTNQAGNLSDGVRAFAQKIRTANYGGDRSKCALHPDQDVIQRLFAGKSSAFAGGGARPMDIRAIRQDFPILKQHVHGNPLAWLDNAATTQKPQSVIDAISHYYENNNSNIHRGAHTLAARSTDAFEQAREKVRSFLGAASAKEIIFVRGTTEGINLVAQTYGRKFLQPGDEIILSTLEHHANIVPWQMVAKEKGAVIRVIPVNDQGEIMLEAYESLLGPRTRLVSLAHASNSLGTILPVAEMTHMAKRYGARVLIDGAQSVSHIPVNMQQIGCDFFVFSGHKIFGPTGIGVVFAKQELQEIMPPWQGGGNMIKTVTFEETTYSEPPAKFEAGTPNVADTVGLGAALDYVNRLGLPNIAKYEHELLMYGTERLSRINGLRLIGQAREKVGVLSFVLHNKDTVTVGKMLDQEGIAVRAGHHCSQPSLRRFGLDATVRPSLAFYNTPEEIDRLADAIQRIQRRF